MMVAYFVTGTLGIAPGFIHRLETNLLLPTSPPKKKKKEIDYNVKWKCCDKPWCIIFITEMNLHRHVKTVSPSVFGYL